MRRLAFPLAKLAILALVIWGGYRTVAAAIGELQQHGWTVGRLQPGWVLAAGILYLASQFPCGWFWHGVLAGLGQRVGLARALRAYYIGHLGKYVPGKAMVVILRATLIGRPHVKTSLAVTAVFYETFTTMACGAALAAVILLAGHREQTWLIVGSLGLALVVGLPTVPSVFVRLLQAMRLTPRPSIGDKATEQVADSIRLHLGLLVRGWIGIAAGWVLAGASLWATVRAIGVDDTNLLAHLPLYTATVALAIVLGFVSMLPAGLGVRDIVLMQLLAPLLDELAPNQGQALALVAVIVLRLIWLMAEVLLSAVLYPLGIRSSGRQAGPHGK